MYFYLRLFQKTTVNAVYEHLGNKDTNPFVVLPTGTGKSVVLAQRRHSTSRQSPTGQIFGGYVFR